MAESEKNARVIPPELAPKLVVDIATGAVEDRPRTMMVLRGKIRMQLLSVAWGGNGAERRELGRLVPNKDKKLPAERLLLVEER